MPIEFDFDENDEYENEDDGSASIETDDSRLAPAMLAPRDDAEMTNHQIGKHDTDDFKENNGLDASVSEQREPAQRFKVAWTDAEEQKLIEAVKTHVDAAGVPLWNVISTIIGRAASTCFYRFKLAARRVAQYEKVNPTTNDAPKSKRVNSITRGIDDAKLLAALQNTRYQEPASYTDEDGDFCFGYKVKWEDINREVFNNQYTAHLLRVKVLNGAHPHRSRTKWTVEEDDKLRKFATTNAGQLSGVAEHFHYTRSYYDCYHRWKNVLSKDTPSSTEAAVATITTTSQSSKTKSKKRKRSEKDGESKSLAAVVPAAQLVAVDKSSPEHKKRKVVDEKLLSNRSAQPSQQILQIRVKFSVINTLEMTDNDEELKKHRVTIADANVCSLPTLIDTLSEICGQYIELTREGGSCRIQYQDRDSDWVEMSTEHEWREARREYENIAARSSSAQYPSFHMRILV